MLCTALFGTCPRTPPFPPGPRCPSDRPSQGPPPGQCHCRRRPPCSADPTGSGLWFQPGPRSVLSVSSRCPPVSTSSRLRAPPGVPCLVPGACVNTPFFSLPVHGSVLSLASSASSTYSSVRAPRLLCPPSSPLQPGHLGGSLGWELRCLGAQGLSGLQAPSTPTACSEAGEHPGPRARSAPRGGGGICGAVMGVPRCIPEPPLCT